MSEIHWAQTKYPSSRLGDGQCSDGRTIAQAGCKVTTGADILTFMGHQVDPPTLNEEMLKKAIFQNHCLLPNDFLQRDHPELLRLESFSAFAGPANLKLADNTPADLFVELRIAWPHGLAKDNVHFLLVYNYKAGAPASSLMVLDSWDGAVKPLSHYGDPATIITGISRWRVVPHATPPATVPPPPPPPPVPVTAPAPAVPPQPTHPPDPMYDVIVGDDHLSHSTADLAFAKAAADELAKDTEGLIVQVLGDHAQIVYEPQAFFAFRSSGGIQPADGVMPLRSARELADAFAKANVFQSCSVLSGEHVVYIAGPIKPT